MISEKKKLFHTCTRLDNAVFCFSSHGNLPMFIELEMKKIFFIKNIEGYQSFITQDIFSVGDDIVSLELNGKRVLRYNSAQKKCCYFDINCHKKDWDNYAAFAAWGNFVYIFPKYISRFTIFDIKTGEIKESPILYTEEDCLNDNVNDEESAYFDCGCQVGDEVWLFRKKDNALIEFDMKSGTWETYKLPIKIQNCIHICEYNEKLYILSSEGNVYIWGINTHCLEWFGDYGSGENIYDFSRAVVTDKNIYLLPSLGEKVISIDLKTKKSEIYQNYPQDFQYCGDKAWSKYHGYCEDDSNYYFAMRSANYMLMINKSSGTVCWIKLELDTSENYIDIYNYYNDDRKNIFQESYVSLEDLLSYMSSKDKFDFQDEDILHFGLQTWEEVKQT